MGCPIDLVFKKVRVLLCSYASIDCSGFEKLQKIYTVGSPQIESRGKYRMFEFWKDLNCRKSLLFEDFQVGGGEI